MASFFNRRLAGLALLTLIYVSLPSPAHAAASTFTIDQDGDVDLFLQAIGIADARINISGNVTLDLSGLQDLHIARGVQIIGDRSVYPTGPRIVSSTAHTGEPARYLFLVGDEWQGLSPGVRISGIRLDGGAGSDASNKVGISVRGSHNVEIDHSEFYGWGRAAIEIIGTSVDIDSRSNRAAATSVRVHDNYIHDNQAPKGYGVSLGRAYALIEKNVFFNNRHSVVGDGTAHTGYLVYRNLELNSNGYAQSEPRMIMYPHYHCDPLTDFECGSGGEFMDIRYNSVQHIGGSSFKLAGFPSIHANVAYNMFGLSRYAALDAGSSRFSEWGNLFGFSGWDDSKFCDFDGDGAVDRFLTTGVSWWYKSTLAGYRWTYLNQSTLRASSVSLGDVTGDGLCDVSSAGVVYRSGIGATRGTDVLWRRADRTSALMWQLATDGNVYGTRDPGPALPASDEILASGDFDGDGDSDLLTRSPNGLMNRVLLDDGVGIKDPQIILVGTMKGVGDFDADGADDVLWTRAEGKIEIWFSGMQQRSVSIPDAPAFPVYTRVEGAGDFDGDGRADILILDAAGNPTVWKMRGEFIQGLIPISKPAGTWLFQRVGDFDGDRRADLLLRSISGQLAIAFGAGGFGFPSYQNLPGQLVEDSWGIIGVADMNADGRSDIFWRNGDTGWVTIWTLNGATWTGSVQPGHDGGGAWQVAALLPLRFKADAMPPGRNAVQVPDLIGMTRTEAFHALRVVGLVPGTVGERVDCENLNRVSEQIPNQLRVAPGTSVRLWFGVRPTAPAQCQ
jgi:hypothetical protein